MAGGWKMRVALAWEGIFETNNKWEGIKGGRKMEIYVQDLSVFWLSQYCSIINIYQFY